MNASYVYVRIFMLTIPRLKWIEKDENQETLKTKDLV